jgi:hypothetical protein
MLSAMTATQDARKQFEQAGFEVSPSPVSSDFLEVRKYNCSHTLKRNPGGHWVPDGPPRFLVRGLKCELEDRGYQKFWYHEGQRFPIRLADLKALHRFDEEVREILQLKSLYNESLGSISARTVYDRVTGRPDPLVLK